MHKTFRPDIKEMINFHLKYIHNLLKKKKRKETLYFEIIRSQNFVIFTLFLKYTLSVQKN